MLYTEFGTHPEIAEGETFHHRVIIGAFVVMLSLKYTKIIEAQSG